jgi:DNA-binding MarR family transcriptional regulator
MNKTVRAIAPLSESERELWFAIKKLGEHALSQVGNEIERCTGLSGSDFGVLTRLEDLGGGALGQSELGKSLDWDKSRLSHHLSRMEKRDLVARETAEGGRGVIIVITETGRREIAAARPIHADAVRRHLLQHISTRDAAVILKLARRLSAR